MKVRRLGLVSMLAAVHLATTCALLASVRARGLSVTGAVFDWDGAFYRAIAQHGYPHAVPVVDGHAQVSTLAFFPLFPLLLGALGELGIPLVVAALLLNFLLSVAAGWVIFRLLSTCGTAEVAKSVALLWVLIPPGFVTALCYSEPLFVLLVGTCLLAVQRNRLGMAAAAGFGAGLTRPTGAVLALAVVWLVWCARRDGGRWLALAGVALAPVVALVTFLGYLRLRLGVWDGWQRTEREGFSVHFDFGRDNAARLVGAVAHPGAHPPRLGGALVVVVATVGLVYLWRTSVPRHLWLLSAGFLALGVSSSGALSSLPRFLVPAFPLLVPVAEWLQRRSAGVRYRVTAVTLLACAALTVLLGTYFLTSSPAAP